LTCGNIRTFKLPLNIQKIADDRTGITGARWTTSGAQAILRHRVIAANHDDDTYRNYYNQQEHQRNHQNRYASQDNLTLTA
jgi:hypothetical protein